RQPDNSRKSFEEALDADPERKVFDDKFFSSISERRRNQEKTYWKLILANWGILIILTVNAIATAPEFSLLGVRITQISRFKEILLFLSTTLSFFLVTMLTDIN